MLVSITILISALMLGIASDFLFHDSIVRSTPNGISVVLWSLTATATLVGVTRITKARIERKCLWWLVPINLCGFAYMWRDSAILHGIDSYLMMFSLVMLSFGVKGNVAQANGVASYIRASVITATDALVEALYLIKIDLPWKKIVPPQFRQNVPALVRGVSFSVPLLVLFCALFMSADAAFAGLLNKGLRLNFSDISVHLVILLGFSWCTAGYLRPMFAADKSVSNNQIEQDKQVDLESLAPPGFVKVYPTIGRVELNVVLALLNLLFLSFVMVQFRYFFGGSNLVETTSGLSYAEYARKGFFELATVSALVLPMLLLGDWFLPRHRDKFDKIFPAQAGIQIALLFVIMSSAIQRMNLYQQEYGLTELRFYVYAFIGCMAVVYFIFAATVLAGKRSKFAFAASTAGFVVVALLQCANPDRIIMTANIENTLSRGKQFDSNFALSLSSDATAYLVDHVAKLPFKTQTEIAAGLLTEHDHAWHYDFRSFNIARAEAYSAVTENLPLLKAINTIGAIADPAHN